MCCKSSNQLHYVLLPISSGFDYDYFNHRIQLEQFNPKEPSEESFAKLIFWKNYNNEEEIPRKSIIKQMNQKMNTMSINIKRLQKQNNDIRFNCVSLKKHIDNNKTIKTTLTKLIAENHILSKNLHEVRSNYDIMLSHNDNLIDENVALKIENSFLKHDD